MNRSEAVYLQNFENNNLLSELLQVEVRNTLIAINSSISYVFEYNEEFYDFFQNFFSLHFRILLFTSLLQF